MVLNSTWTLQHLDSGPLQLDGKTLHALHAQLLLNSRLGGFGVAFTGACTFGITERNAVQNCPCLRLRCCMTPSLIEWSNYPIRPLSNMEIEKASGKLHHPAKHGFP